MTANKEHDLTDGVTNAAFLHPYFWNTFLPRSIMMRVTDPVADEKLPMKEEYALGSGYAA